MSANPFYAHGPRRVCRLFWCYHCHCMVRIISSPSIDSFCPRCYGQFIHELDMPRPYFLVDFSGLRNPPTWQPRDNAVSHRARQREVPEPAVSPATNPGDYFTGPGLNQLIDELTQNDRPGLPPAPVKTGEPLEYHTINLAP
ncbi:hypothetical protein J5N97_002872 [Dioscorea zingiberensis]|uniref:RING-type E3 ubiquitin transferase n=1 Tax=Dioscorea zingiberensis TaxID=325984 RepID=A0A9D5D343_9LILI|nr:hypothetical protein J5N97_002872 [Dioscorea zingiberensis]